MFDTRFNIGNIGEEVVNNFFINAIRSKDWYDSKKDGCIGDMTYEVKTFRLNNKTKSFWVGQNKTQTMWNKLDNVDLLFFIKIPESKNEKSILYLSTDHKNSWKMFYKNDGTTCRGYMLNKCLPLTEISIELSNILLENSKSISNHRRFS
jgi:SRSO17 transposase